MGRSKSGCQVRCFFMEAFAVFSWLHLRSIFVHIRSYSSIFVHIRFHSSIFVHIHGFIYGYIRSYSSIFVHLCPFTSTDVDWRRPFTTKGLGSLTLSKIQEWFLPKIQEPHDINPYEIDVLQRKIENRGYLGKSTFDRWKPGKSTFSPKTWNHPMVIAVNLAGAVCSKHTLKIDVFQKSFSVNVRALCECKSNLPHRQPSIGMFPDT